MSESTVDVNGGQLQDFTIDQFAGATALVLGSFGGLLMIIWKSRCACRVRLGLSDKCYLFDCQRLPPDPTEPDSSDEEQGKGKKDKDKDKKENLIPDRKSFEIEPEPEPEFNP